MLSHAFVVILLAIAVCILLAAFVSLLVVVVELLREAVVMAQDWHDRHRTVSTGALLWVSHRNPLEHAAAVALV